MGTSYRTNTEIGHFIRKSIILICVLQIFIPKYEARSDSSLPELTSFKLCTQNLLRYGEKKGKERTEQRRDLVERMALAKCDVVALQEIYGENRQEARNAINGLRKNLEKITQTKYKAIIGGGFDPYIRNGFLYKTDSAKFIFSRSVDDEILPKLQALGPNERQPTRDHRRIRTYKT